MSIEVIAEIESIVSACRSNSGAVKIKIGLISNRDISDLLAQCCEQVGDESFKCMVEEILGCKNENATN